MNKTVRGGGGITDQDRGGLAKEWFGARFWWGKIGVRDLNEGWIGGGSRGFHIDALF